MLYERGRSFPPSIFSFGGSFFALVDTTKLDIGEINAKTVPAYTELGMKIRDKVNAEVKIQHPTLDITEVDLVEFYGQHRIRIRLQ